VESKNKCNKKAIVKFAGAFIAWIIGSGFSTGQEVLQFFASYGYLSYGVILLNLIGFLFLGPLLLVRGFEHKSEEAFNQFKYFCGERLGTFYSWLIPVILVLIMPVLISGAGATLNEYYRINHYIGSAFMAGAVLCAYLIGFERLIKIVSSIGPMIIFFSLLVGTITIYRDFDNFVEVAYYGAVLSAKQSSPHWMLSSLLYLSLCFLSGSTYFTALGISAVNRKDAKYGALLAAVALILCIGIVSTAILLNGKNTAVLEIPMLHLAEKISSILGAIFSIVLILGMFSSCSAMMWTVCSRFIWGGKRGNRFFAGFVAIFIFLLGMFPFSELISVFYPLVGYIGLPYLGCLLYRGIRCELPIWNTVSDNAKN
jgi:uncharacterized membrane protein YkvI